MNLLRNLACLSLTFVLASCATNELATINPSISEVISAKYLLTVSTAPGDTATGLEQRYSGTVSIFRPEAGFAVIAVNSTPADSASVLSVDINNAPVSLPEVKTASSGSSLTAQEEDTWSEGIGAWTSGAGAWTSGAGAWTSGIGTSLSPSLNTAAWAQIHLPQAQKMASNTGTGVTVAVIDTGIDLNHPAFSGHLTSGWDFIDGDAIPQEGFSPLGPNAAFGHGTMVAGVILNVAPKATIMPLRVMNQEGRGDMNNVIKAIDWAVGHGAQIINLSLGTKLDLASVNAEMAYAVSKNIIFVASSGNSGDTNVSYPAAKAASGGWANAVIGVGSVSTKNLDVKSSFSTYGAKLNMVSTGEQLYGPFPNNQVANATGTSFAAPTVSGGLALAIGQGKPYIAADLAQTLTQSTDLLDAQLGRGRLNLETFLNKAMVP
jgi:thermitase